MYPVTGAATAQTTDPPPADMDQVSAGPGVSSMISGAAPARNQLRLVLRIVGAASLPLVVLVIFGIVQGKVLAEARVAEERIALAQAGALAAWAFVDGNLSTVRSLARVRAVAATASSPALEETYRAIQAENPDWVGGACPD